VDSDVGAVVAVAGATGVDVRVGTLVGTTAGLGVPVAVGTTFGTTVGVDGIVVADVAVCESPAPGDVFDPATWIADGDEITISATL
jgi:hypothetical protein